MSEFIESDTFETKKRPISYRVYTKLSKPMYWIPAASLFIADVLSFVDVRINKPPVLRQLLPEPFDLFDHAGVLVSSMNAGFFTSLIIGKLGTMVAGLDMEKHHNKVETVARVAGISAVLGQCILTETPWGVGQLNSAGFQMTADTVDFVYGMVVGSLAATTVGLVANEPTPNFED